MARLNGFQIKQIKIILMVNFNPFYFMSAVPSYILIAYCYCLCEIDISRADCQKIFKLFSFLCRTLVYCRLQTLQPLHANNSCNQQKSQPEQKCGHNFGVSTGPVFLFLRFWHLTFCGSVVSSASISQA